MHRILLALAATVAVTFTAPGQSTTLPWGTPVRVKLLQFISSETSQPGDVVRFEVFEDVVVRNLVVISRRTPVVGSITTAKAHRSLSSHWPWWTRSSPGKLAFTIVETRSVDGRIIRLSGPIVDRNPSTINPEIPWHHEGEVFDAIVLAGTSGNLY
jgi:hypothetical protein